MPLPNVHTPSTILRKLKPRYVRSGDVTMYEGPHSVRSEDNPYSVAQERVSHSTELVLEWVKGIPTLWVYMEKWQR